MLCNAFAASKKDVASPGNALINRQTAHTFRMVHKQGMYAAPHNPAINQQQTVNSDGIGAGVTRACAVV